MSSVLIKRYQPSTIKINKYMIETDGGEWVRYTDHIKALEQLAEDLVLHNDYTLRNFNRKEKEK